MLAWLALSAAFAQDTGYDAHALWLVPSAGGPLDGVHTWRPEVAPAGAWSARAAFEYADSSLLLQVPEADGTTTIEPVVDNLVVANVAGAWSVSDRAAVTIAFPAYLSSKGLDGNGSPGLGDIRLAVPMSLVPRTDQGGAVGVVPFLNAPTGNSDAFLGERTLSGGLLVTAGVSNDKMALSGNLGVSSAPSIQFNNLRGGAHATLAASGAYAFTDQIGARLEVDFRPALARNDVSWTEAPGEALLSVGGRHGPGVSWTVGGALPYTPGVGAAKFRVFVGVGFSPDVTASTPVVVEAPVVDADSDHDGVVDAADVCPSDNETANGFADEDGCPDALASFTVLAQDRGGKPLAGVHVVAGGVDKLTGADGVARWDGVRPGASLGASVQIDGYAPATVAEALVHEGDNAHVVALDALLGKLHVSVTSAAAGKVVAGPLDALLTLTGPAAHDPVHTGADGDETFELPPGAWTIVVTADRYEPQTVEVVVTAGASEPTSSAVALVRGKR